MVRNLSNDIRGLIFELSRIVKLRNQQELPAVAKMRKDLLACIKRIAEIHVADTDGTDIQATLLVFDDADCTISLGATQLGAP